MQEDKPIYLYLDQHQCDDFEVSYFGSGTLTIAASILLRSKSGGYDRWHRNILESFGGETITLMKSEARRPGWYLLVGYNEADFPEAR